MYIILVGLISVRTGVLINPTSRSISFDGENISFNASLVIHINNTNISPIMIINRIFYYYWYSALGPVWAEIRVLSGDWCGSRTLHPRQVLRGSLPLLSPRFLYVPIFHHQVPTRPPRRERSQLRKWELWARMLSGNFA